LVAAIEAAQNQIEQQTDSLSFRVFRLYLAGSAYEFRSGRLNVYQTLLAKPVRGQCGLPLTRADCTDRGKHSTKDPKGGRLIPSDLS
jgi:cyclopropane-fatty-acyl-phospholipid synthase